MRNFLFFFFLVCLFPGLQSVPLQSYCNRIILISLSFVYLNVCSINRSRRPFFTRFPLLPDLDFHFDPVPFSLPLKRVYIVCVRMRVYIVCVHACACVYVCVCLCVWFFAELSLSSQAEIHIWFATYCNACLPSRPIPLSSIYLESRRLETLGPPFATRQVVSNRIFFRFERGSPKVPTSGGPSCSRLQRLEK